MGQHNHQPRRCLLDRLFRCRSRKTSKLRVTGLCAGISPVPGGFFAQRASKAEDVSIWWRHHDIFSLFMLSMIKWQSVLHLHYGDVVMGAMASQITSLTIVYSTVYSGTDQRKHQSSASLAFVWGIHRGPVNSPHKWPVTQKMFPFDDVIMCISNHFALYVKFVM